MNKLYYFLRYTSFICIGYLIKYIGIPSIYTMPYIVPVLYNYLAIVYGIKRPLEKRKDIKYKDMLFLMIILTSILNIIIIYISNMDIIGGILLFVFNMIELIFSKPKYEKIEEQTQKNIEEYFSKHNDEKD